MTKGASNKANLKQNKAKLNASNMYINSNATSFCNMLFNIIYSLDDQFSNLSDIDVTRT